MAFRQGLQLPQRRLWVHVRLLPEYDVQHYLGPRVDNPGGGVHTPCRTVPSAAPKGSQTGHRQRHEGRQQRYSCVKRVRLPLNSVFPLTPHDAVYAVLGPKAPHAPATA